MHFKRQSVRLNLEFHLELWEPLEPESAHLRRHHSMLARGMRQNCLRLLRQADADQLRLRDGHKTALTMISSLLCSKCHPLLETDRKCSCHLVSGKGEELLKSVKTCTSHPVMAHGSSACWGEGRELTGGHSPALTRERWANAREGHKASELQSPQGD